MEGQHQRASGGRKRRRKRKSAGRQKPSEPVMIVARRPDSPLLSRPTSRMIAASAKPKPAQAADVETEANLSSTSTSKTHAAPRDETARERRARIVQATNSDADEHKRLYEQLIARLVASEGAIAISRAANELWDHEFTLPAEQLVQLQLLEHVDESRVRDALRIMRSLLAHQVPIKRPVLDQRLRRLEEDAEERETREAAAELRREIRSN